MGVSMLQWYHHAGVLIVCWGGNFYQNESVIVATMCNSFVHTCMYTYFALSVYNRKVPMKTLLTALQLVQFYFSLWTTSSYFDFECFAERKGRAEHLIYCTFYVWGLVILFMKFFYDS